MSFSDVMEVVSEYAIGVSSDEDVSNAIWDLIAEKQASAIRADREKLAGLVEDGICIKVHDDLYRQGQCNGLRDGLETAATIIRTTSIGDENNG